METAIWLEVCVQMNNSYNLVLQEILIITPQTCGCRSGIVVTWKLYLDLCEKNSNVGEWPNYINQHVEMLINIVQPL